MLEADRVGKLLPISRYFSTTDNNNRPVNQMLFEPCASTGCSRIPDRVRSRIGDEGGPCLLCEQRFCGEHVQEHQCPTLQDADNGEAFEAGNKRKLAEQKLSLISAGMFVQSEATAANTVCTVEFKALQARLAARRDGISCSIEPSEVSSITASLGSRLLTDLYSQLAGGMSIHLQAAFEDGVVWLIRLRNQNAACLPDEVERLRLSGQVATLHFLHGIRASVPTVLDFDVTPGTIGVPFLAYPKLDAVDSFWSNLDPATQSRILNQLADVLITIKDHPLPAFGCLDTPGSTAVGPLLGMDGITVDHIDGSARPVVGPFRTNRDFYCGIINRYLELIATGQAYQYQNPQSVELATLLYLQLLADHDGDDTSPAVGYVRHEDDKGDHLLYNNDTDTLFVIDWDCAAVVPAAAAFSAPLFLLDTRLFYEGDNELSAGELELINILRDKGQLDLASYVEMGRHQHRFQHCLGIDVQDDDFPAMFGGYLPTTNLGMTYADWLQWAPVRYATELFAIMQRRQDSVRC